LNGSNRFAGRTLDVAVIQFAGLNFFMLHHAAAAIAATGAPITAAGRATLPG
jgi:hypothetical protein